MGDARRREGATVKDVAANPAGIARAVPQKALTQRHRATEKTIHHKDTKRAKARKDVFRARICATNCSLVIFFVTFVSLW